MFHYSFDSIGGTKFELTCPLLPCAERWVDVRQKATVGQLRWSLRNYFVDDVIQRLLDCLPASVQANIMSEFLFFYIQQGHVRGIEQRKAINDKALNVIRLCPKAIFSRDEEGMTCLHYFCMRNSCEKEWPTDSQLLSEILNVFPESPMTANAFGESPTHQLCGQAVPNVHFLKEMISACPHASRQPMGVSGKLPIHIIMSLTRSRDRKDNQNLYSETIASLVTAYPEGAFKEVVEDVYVLRIGRGSDRRKKTWTPYSIAMEEGNQKYRIAIENQLLSFGIQYLRRSKKLLN